MKRVLPEAFLCALAREISLEEAWRWQQQWQQRLLSSGGPELLLLLQHPACYTLGRGASLEHLHFDPQDPPAPLHRLDRGGEVTHHVPGQLVAYPVVDLQRHQPDLHWYLRQLEGMVLDVIEQQGLSAERREGLTGVWLEGKKVAAIGVGCRRWVTQHGLALNVSCDLAGFEAITPCGLQLPVGRLDQWRPGVNVQQLQQPLAASCCKRMGWSAVEWINEQTLRSWLESDG